jgi:3-hydroxyisobutyrate dehydrogenase-like beta-hydroxyacid dehydrogenase
MTAFPVGFVGLGVMGGAMSARVLAGSTAVTGYDPDPDRTSEHVARGGHAAATPRDAAAGSAVLVTSLPHPQALTSALQGPDGVLAGAHPGLVVLETSTLGLAAKEAARTALAEVGATLLDCPMSGTGAQARTGDVVAYLSGDDDAKVLARPVLDAFTRGTHDLGAFGNGTRVKLVANLLVAVHNTAAAEALVLAQRAGLDLDVVLRAVGDGAGTSRMLEVRGPLMARGEFDDATMRVSTFLKDLDLINEFAHEVAVPVPLLALTSVLYRAAAAQGRGSQDTASVFAVLAGLAGVTPPPAG